MASTPQKSKGKRPPLRDRLAALEPKYGYCPDCGQKIHNRGAHAEACPGRAPAGFQCARCLGVYDRAGTCCGQRTYPYYRAAGGERSHG